jgi:hypothetical protein
MNYPSAPRFRKGQALTASDLNEISERVDALMAQINQLQNLVQDRQGTLTVPVKRGTAISGQAGRYNGRIIPPFIVPKSAPGDLAEADIGADPGYDDCEIWDLTQCGLEVARVIGVTGTRKVAMVGGIFLPVTCASDGGSAGDSDDRCSFTYTIEDLDGNELATDVEYVGRNANELGAKFAADKGIALRSGGTWVLWWANETDDTGACT